MLVFLHGYGGTGRGERDNPAFRQWAMREQTALILPDGIDNRWSVTRERPGPRDDFAFIEDVVADAQNRFALRDIPVFLSGFSLGGSMVWSLACADPHRFAGYIAFSGAFWEPAPKECAHNGAPIVHFHGSNDPTVPPEGREIRSGGRQAPLSRAFTAIASARGCTVPPVWQSLGQVTPVAACSELSGCRTPNPLTFCEHHEGHNFRLEWLTWAIRKIEDNGVIQK